MSCCLFTVNSTFVLLTSIVEDCLAVGPAWHRTKRTVLKFSQLKLFWCFTLLERPSCLSHFVSSPVRMSRKGRRYFSKFIDSSASDHQHYLFLLVLILDRFMLLRLVQTGWNASLVYSWFRAFIYSHTSSWDVRVLLNFDMQYFLCHSRSKQLIGIRTCSLHPWQKIAILM